DGSIKFPDIAAALDDLLTEDEKRTLSRTSQYAFYTAEPALRSMWSLAQRLGFKDGRVFEPGMGVGGFPGTMPAQVRGVSQYRGIELDHVTAAIAKRLYPESQIDQGDFIKTPLPQDYYDLVIGNPPFAGIKVQADPDYPQGFMLHDYFFAKSLDSVRPGGILMFVTSAGTMNKQDTSARDYLADRADLLGAIRLPNTAFKENGTEVTTDIIVLRKRLDGEKEAGPSWRKAEIVDVPDPDGGTGQAAVNRYFIDHPEMVLGEQGLYDTLTATPRIGVRPRPGSDLAADLSAAIARFAPGVMSEAPTSVRMDTRDAATTERKAGSYYVKDGDLYQFDGAAGVKVERRSRSTPTGMSKGDHETVMALLPIRDALRDVYAADVDGKDATEARARLNATYDAFVKARGPINKQVRSFRRPSIVEQETARQRALEDARAASLDFDEGSFDTSPLFEAGAKLAEIARAREEARKEPGYREGDFNPDDMPDKVVVTYPNIDAFADDPESFRLRAIEKYDSETDTATKSRVFTENAVTISVKPTISSPEDALLYVLSEHGRVDLNKIADLSGSTPGAVRQDLGDKIFEDPESGEWQTAAQYLSGNVRKKLGAAREVARKRP
ncbi:MAG TPA: N-6 DNA methylase, partial [Terrimesophilobacter sp.]|nr:N-6 DNA methylase [Terrimesophilobacter sp.]